MRSPTRTTPHDIGRVERAVLDHLELVQIVAELEDNVFRIFEPINNIGMRLDREDQEGAVCGPRPRGRDAPG